MPLHPDFVKACKIHLPELFRIWLSVDPEDQRRVTRIITQDDYNTRAETSIERYRGGRTSTAFRERIEGSEAYHELSKAIAEYQPELTHHLILPERNIYLANLANSAALISIWCRFLETKILTESIITAFSGIRLPCTRNSIALGPDACLRTLSEEELIELGSEDIVFNENIDFVRFRVSCCLELRATDQFNLIAAAPRSMIGIVERSCDNVFSVKSILHALHVLKTTPIEAYLSRAERHPKILPGLHGSVGFPGVGIMAPPSVLEEHEIESFIAIEKELRQSPREEIRIAADRLVEAAHRSSRVDAIVDAVIGLEILLKPADADELNFRVALNSAFLGPPECRRQRFDEIRDIQKLRNKIVHGSTRHRGPEAEERLGKAAEAAMNALRDALKRFITDPSLQGNKPLDAEFWLKRLFDQKE